MATHKKISKSVQSDIRRMDVQDEKLSTFLVDRYKDRFVDVERERKVLLNRLTAVTKGKSIIMENKH